MQERWRAVVGYEDLYRVSNFGRVRSLDRVAASGKGYRTYKGKVLVGHIRAPGYHRVLLCRDGKQVNVCVHRLVMEAFVGPCPKGHEVAHRNGNPSDNHLSNLRYDTPKGNCADRKTHGTDGTGDRNSNAFFSEENIRRIRRLHGRVSGGLIARITGVKKEAIYKIWKGRTWSHVT